ncbi:pilus assembly protein CpaE [Glaciibacter flavus]|uniref:Pilus assembly protein CpaE n=1 Tax=Orlajensenia flava TaxID=2565934 RepID=A0A4S4FVU0_9MICO|nr:pilus assembly protein CpaE [Glaciibacter flavus]THG34152.1 pilus assembly protein CpaE [Glaciibacter flavus]
MISRELSGLLRDAGLVWHPESGDRFQIDIPDIDDDIFTVSEMTIEAQHHPTGTVLGFNGTTEWALDSLPLDQAVWLPREDQLREMLRSTFRSLHRMPDTFEVSIVIDGAERTFDHPEPAEAYGQALLALIQRASA